MSCTLIESVDRHSPAERAGIEAGETLLNVVHFLFCGPNAAGDAENPLF